MSLPLAARPIERRVTASYLIAFAVVLGIFALAVHAAFVVLLERDVSDRVGALVIEGRNAVEIHHHKRRVDEDTVQLVDPRAEGVTWFDAAGRPLSHVGLFASDDVLRSGTLASDSTSLGSPDPPDVRAPVTVEAVVTRAPGRRELAQLDIGLAIGLAAALLVATVGGRFLARRSIERVVVALRTMRAFTADAAHELRGPLAALASNAGASLRDADDLPAVHRRRLETIAATAASLGRTVDDLLLLARAESPIERELFAVDVAERVREVAASRKTLASDRRIALNVAAPRDEAGVYGNPAEIDRIVENLLDNALRYTPDGGSVTLACEPARAGVTVRVTDTGRGIAAADLPKIFDRFWRGEPARSRDGTGLGLAIVRALARRHGGNVSARSSLGSGSEFAVWLPARPPQPGLHDFSTGEP